MNRYTVLIKCNACGGNIELEYEGASEKKLNISKPLQCPNCLVIIF